MFRRAFNRYLCCHPPSGAQDGVAPKPGKPVYNPETKSYFELRVDLPKPPDWNTAVRYARTRRYKGVRGRLAIIRMFKRTASFRRISTHWGKPG
jgi:hypothetical protein